jgi:AcrR family transcriptional regulator
MKQADKSNETKRRVQKVALELFSTKGYDATTMQDIIDSSGMSRGAIYHQYKSKQEILEVLTTEAQEKIQAYLSELEANTTLRSKDKIGHLIAYMTDNALQKRLIQAGWVEKVPFALLDTLRYSLKEFAPLLASILQKGAHNGEYVCDEPLLTAECILLLLDVWLDPIIFTRPTRDMIARIDYFVRVTNHLAPGLMDDTLAENLKRVITTNR